MLELHCIKTDECVYISMVNNNHVVSCINYLFDDEKPKPTYRNDWYSISKVPDRVSLIVKPVKINIRYKLYDHIKESEERPTSIKGVEKYYSSYLEEYTCIPEEYVHVYEFYTEEHDLSEERYEEIEFKTVLLAEVYNFEIKRLDYNVKHRLFDEITTHPVLLSTKPCELSKKESYEIIRKYIKQHIDLDYAKITSDYDFCFSVEKIITLSAPEAYTTDINFDIFAKRPKKPKYVTRYRNDRRVKMFEMAPDKYNQYPIVKPFRGENYEDLVKNINKYLEELIAEINKPLVDCPHCSGLGVILKINSGEGY